MSNPLKPAPSVLKRRSQQDAAEAASARVVGLTLSPTDVRLQPGEAVQLSAKALTVGGESVDPEGVKFRTTDPAVAEATEKGLIMAKGAGSTTISAEVGGVTATSTINVAKSSPATCDTYPGFRDKVDPVFQSSCVSCHGSTANAVARAAMPIDPSHTDEEALRANFAAAKLRLNMAAPMESRLLTKATGVVAHGGGATVKPNSREASVLSDWLKAEAACQREVTIASLEVTPAHATVRQDGTVSLQAMTKTASGELRNISSQAQWTVKNPRGDGMSPEQGSVSIKADSVLLGFAKAPHEWVVEARYGDFTAVSKISVIPRETPPTPPPPVDCPSLTAFKTKVAPVLHSSCGSCHYVGGFASGAYAIVRDDTTCEANHENWQKARERINRESTARSTLLGKPSGSLPHGGGAVLGTSGAAYKNLAAWVDQDSQCYSKNPTDRGLDAPTLCYKEALSLTISPASATMDIGQNLELAVQASFADRTTGRPYDVVTWLSSMDSVAKVSVDGIVTAVSAGTATITAKSGKVSAETRVSVRVPRTLTGIALTPTLQEVAAGETADYKVYDVYSNGDKEPRTRSVTWSTADATIATPLSGGRILSKKMGTTTVTARGDGCGVCSATANLKVLAAKPQALVIEPTPALVTIGQPTRLKLFQLLTDGTKISVSDRATWTSSDTRVLDIDSLGNATGKDSGAADVTVSYATFNVRTTVLVVSASGCSSLDAYKTKLDPMLQAQCIGCHKAGGPGAGALTLKGPSPTADDVLANWKDVKRRIDNPDPLRTAFMVRALNSTHPGSTLLGSSSTNYKTLLDWVNIEVGCQVSNVPSSLSRNSGKVLYQRLTKLFPTAVSNGTDTKPLFDEEFDALRAEGSFRLIGQKERSLSPLAQVLWRNKVNTLCQPYILGTDADEMFKLTPDLLLTGESSPTEEALRLALTVARRAWLYPYTAQRPEVIELANLYKNVLALGGASAARTARQTLCVAALTAPQFLLGNAGEDDVVRRVALEVGGVTPAMADFTAYRTATDKGAALREYIRRLQSASETRPAYMARLTDWHRQWLGLRDFINPGLGVWSREPSSQGSTARATGVGGGRFITLPVTQTGFSRTIEKGLETLNLAAFDFSEACSAGVDQPFDPRTTDLIWEHWNPKVNRWEEVGRWSKNGDSWTTSGGGITLDDGSMRATTLRDITLVTQLKDSAGTNRNYYNAGNLKGTPVDGFDSNNTPTGRKRRVRRLSPSGIQNGYSTVRLWWSGEEVRVCNSISRFLASCAYRPAKANPSAVPPIPNLDVTTTVNNAWNAFDLSRPRIGRTITDGGRDSFAHPVILESFRCGIPDQTMLAVAHLPSYVESQAFPKGYANLTDPIDPSLLNAVATNVYDLLTFEGRPSGYRHSVASAVIKANQTHPNAKAEDKAFGRLMEDVTMEPIRLVEQLISTNSDYRSLLTAPYTLGRAELDLYYRSQGYSLPAYPPGFNASELGSDVGVRRIEYTSIPNLPVGWLRNSSGGYGADQGEILEVATMGMLKPRLMSGILTQTAFLAPVKNDGKTRSVSARVHERLLCGLPNEFVNALDSNALSLHEMYVSTKGPTSALHLDRTKGCYSCHVTLDPVASVFSKRFMSDPNVPGNTELRRAKIWDYREQGFYGLKGGGLPASGVFLGQRVEGVRSLGEAIANSKEFSNCVVKTAFENVFGRQPVGSDVTFISSMAERFRTRLDYNYNLLIEELVASPELRTEN